MKLGLPRTLSSKGRVDCMRAWRRVKINGRPYIASVLLNMDSDRYGAYYRLIKLLGKGSFGSVYRYDSVYSYQWIGNDQVVKMESDDIYPKTVACKATVLQDKSIDGRRQLREIINSVDFECDSVIKYGVVVDYDNCDKDYEYIVMPFLTGSLTSYLKITDKYGFEDRYIFARTVLKIILEQLTCLYDKGFYYSDIKPDNILVNLNGDRLEMLLGDIELCDMKSCAYTPVYNVEPWQGAWRFLIVQCFIVFLNILDGGSLCKVEESPNLESEVFCKIITPLNNTFGNRDMGVHIPSLERYFLKDIFDMTSMSQAFNNLMELLPGGGGQLRP